MKKLYKLVLLTFAGALLLTVNVQAQSELKKANRLYEKLDYTLAIQHYLEHFKTHDPDAVSAARIAHCYRVNDNSGEAETWYGKAVSMKNSEPINRWYYAEMLKSNGKYFEAKEQYIEYGKSDPGAAQKVAARVKACDDAIAWIASPAPYTVKNEEQLNSENAEFSPMMFGKGMMFASDRVEKNKEYTEDKIHGWSGRPFVKLYFAEEQVPQAGKDAAAITTKGPAAGDEQVKEKSWKEAKMLPVSINSQFHNGPAAFDEKNNTLFYTRTKKVKVSLGEKYADPTGWISNGDKNYINRLEIYTAVKNDTGWTNVRPFQYNNAESYSVGHPALSPDGKVLYFASDMPGGYGETDIYYCELQADGSWSKPLNAGPTINTTGRESFPVVSKEGVLYFSSDGQPGMGGLDLFSAKGSKASWNDVSNMRAPFNSPKDDIGIVFTNGDEEGYFSSDRQGGRGWDDIYSFKKIKPTAPAPDVPKPVTLVLPAVYYDFDKANIRPDAASGLDQVVQALKENPDVKVELGAHCDCRGSDAYNMALSQRRAQSAFNYLVSKGIGKSRLTVKGYGETQLINGCSDGKQCTEAQHQQNRRTEFKIEGDKQLIKN